MAELLRIENSMRTRLKAGSSHLPNSDVPASKGIILSDVTPQITTFHTFILHGYRTAELLQFFVQNSILVQARFPSTISLH